MQNEIRLPEIRDGKVKVSFTFEGRTIEFKMVCDPVFMQDRSLAVCLSMFGTCEPELTKVLMKVLREGQLAIDVGAAVGFFTLAMAQLVGNTGKVVAFEPDARNLDRLKRNIALNKFTNVEVVPKAVSHHVGTVPFFLAVDSGDNSLAQVEHMHKLEQVECTTLDAYPETQEAEFVKIDTEGAEVAILRGADGLLAAQRVPFWCLEINEKALQRMKTSRRMLREHMDQYGYAGWLPLGSGDLPYFVPATTEVVGGPDNQTMLFAREVSVARVWPKIVIPGGND